MFVQKHTSTRNMPDGTDTLPLPSSRAHIGSDSDSDVFSSLIFLFSRLIHGSHLSFSPLSPTVSTRPRTSVTVHHWRALSVYVDS